MSRKKGENREVPHGDIGKEPHDRWYFDLETLCIYSLGPFSELLVRKKSLVWPQFVKIIFTKTSSCRDSKSSSQRRIFLPKNRFE